ncbi:MAG: hypothetical protein JXB88_09885 [Spirochaetales bacterium]|nr:hypothetical protein [Spirochaetales bacterium]
MYKQKILDGINEIQSVFPVKLLDYFGFELIREDNINTYLSRSLDTFPPVFLPVFIYEGNTCAIHLEPGKTWQECTWVLLEYNSVNPVYISSSFEYLPFALLVSPLNRGKVFDEIWNFVLDLKKKCKDTTFPAKETIKAQKEKWLQCMAGYDRYNTLLKLEAATQWLGIKESKDKVEQLYNQFPDDTYTSAAIAIIRHKIQYGNPVPAALKVLKREIPFGFYWIEWAGGGDSGPELLELIRPIALQYQSQDNPFLRLQHSPYTEPETAGILREIAFEFKEEGDDETALNQLRNSMYIAGRHAQAKNRRWYMDLVEQSDRVENDCLAAQLAYYAAGVIQLAPCH